MRVWRIPRGAAAAAALAGRFDNLTVEPSRRVPDPRLRAVVSPDGSVLASIPHYADAPLDFSVRLHGRSSGQLLQTLQGHQARVSALAFSPDGRTLASADPEGTIRFWRVQTGAAVGTIQLPRGPDLLVFLPDGRRLLSGSRAGAIRTHRVPREALRRR